MRCLFYRRRDVAEAQQIVPDLTIRLWLRCRRWAAAQTRAPAARPPQRSISTRVLAELGPWLSFEVPWSRVSMLALPCAHSASSSAPPGRTRRRKTAEHAGRHRVRQHHAGETRAARIIDAHDIALGDAAPPGVVGIDRDRLAPRDLARALTGPGPSGCAGDSAAGWRRDAADRSLPCRAEPFRRLDPGRMRRAIVIAEAGDLLGIKLDAARWRGELVGFPGRRGNPRTSRILRRAAEFPNQPSCQKRSKSGMAAWLVRTCSRQPS